MLLIDTQGCCLGAGLDSSRCCCAAATNSGLKHAPILTAAPSPDKREVVLHLYQCYCTNVKHDSESPVLNSHSFSSWSSCSTLEEAPGCVDTCLSSQGLLE